jgi:hypothetical protein
MNIRTNIIVMLWTAMFFTMPSVKASAQCLIDPCSKHVSAKCIVIKTFDLGKLKEENEVSYVFSKHTAYLIALCSDLPETDVEIELLDYNKNKIASNVISSKQYKSDFVFTCEATGVYYLRVIPSKKTKGTCYKLYIGLNKK